MKRIISVAGVLASSGLIIMTLQATKRIETKIDGLDTKIDGLTVKPEKGLLSLVSPGTKVTR